MDRQTDICDCRVAFALEKLKFCLLCFAVKNLFKPFLGQYDHFEKQNFDKIFPHDLPRYDEEKA